MIVVLAAVTYVVVAVMFLCPHFFLSFLEGGEGHRCILQNVSRHIYISDIMATYVTNE